MTNVAQLEEIKTHVAHIFPDAVRGSVAQSRWGKGRKTLHLCYWFNADTAGGLIVQAKGQLFYYIEWDTNEGYEYKFAESDLERMIVRILSMHKKPQHIMRTVQLGSAPRAEQESSK